VPSPKRLVVLGTLANQPWAGMAWMHMQIAAGLQRLGHQVYYFEVTSSWPYDARLQTTVCDSEYAVSYLARVAEGFGLGQHWAYRRSYADGAWFGLEPGRAQDVLAHADAVFNVAGATNLVREGLKADRLVYLGTDPVFDEVQVVNGDPTTCAFIDQHHDVVTYGENIGTARSPLPALPRLRGWTRQPILLDIWAAGPPERQIFTTVSNWQQTTRDVEFRGERYYWSKNREFLKFVDAPRCAGQPVELALGGNLNGIDPRERARLEAGGWQLTEGHVFSADPWRYRDYIRASAGELTVAKDQNVRLRTGWFSERSACYLGAGRPVITQDTGFGSVLPTGEGLFAFDSFDDIMAAFEAIRSDYARQARAARAIAEEYFRAETVMARLLRDLGLA
jgi:hypothetical protein